MTERFGLKETTVAKIQDVLAHYPPVQKAVLYGSRAKGAYRNGSDIDLTLLGGEDLTHPLLNRIREDIDDLLLPYTLDLSLFRDISDAEVLEHIRRVGVNFYERTSS